MVSPPLPPSRQGHFLVALVFGAKATDRVLQSGVAQEIKTELAAAKAYAEGRGIRIPVVDRARIADLQALIDIKLSS